MVTDIKQTRPDWDLWFLRLAYVTAERGSCLRKRVGALVVRDRDRRIISGGYNGAPRGMPDCLEVGCDTRVIDGRESCVRTLHAESNALDLCGPLSEPHTIYTTVIPCRNCALRIVQHGITRVVFHEYYESQGTKEVEALFELHERREVSRLIATSMPPIDASDAAARERMLIAQWEQAREAGHVARMLNRFDAPMGAVRPAYFAIKAPT